MGQLIDEKHPLFEEFPTEFHTNWQWWPMAGQRAVILPQPMKAIITEMDSYAYMRPMIQLMECRCIHSNQFPHSSLLMGPSPLASIPAHSETKIGKPLPRA